MNKTFIQELMSDHEGRKLYFREDLIFEVTEGICKTMEEKGISKAQLAKLLGVSKNNITQLLSGDHNMRLTSVADLLYALDAKLTVKAEPIEIGPIVATCNVATESDWSLVGGFVAPEIEFEGIDEAEMRQLARAA